MFRLHHIHLLAPDPQGTARWYADMLGASVAGEQSGGSLLVMLGGALLKIDGSAEPLPAGNSGRYFGLEHFGLETNDVASITARAEERGAAILRPVGAGFEGNGVSDTKADIEGPERLRIELQQPAFYWEPTGSGENPFREMVRLHHLLTSGLRTRGRPPGGGQTCSTAASPVSSATPLPSGYGHDRPGCCST